MNRILSLFAIFTLLTACTQHEIAEDYKLPSVALDSCVATSANSFTAYITVDKGEMFNNHSLKLLVYDSKNMSQVLQTLDLPLGKERVQRIEKVFSVPEVNHEYIVSALLKTEKNSFISGTLMVNSANESAMKYYYTWGQPYYYEDIKYEGGAYPDKFATEDIALHFSSNTRFMFYLTNVNVYGKSVEVRVGNHICPVVWSNKTSDDAVFAEVNIPDIEPGTYDVALHWNDGEVPFLKKIRILPLKAEEERVSEEIKKYNIPSSYFRIEDKMYFYAYGEDNKNQLRSYDLNNKKWSIHNTVPYKMSEFAAVGGKGYGITEDYADNGQSGSSFKNSLYEYNPLTDSWKKLASLPVTGEMDNVKIFAAGGNIYICGGRYHSTGNKFMQTWKYDIVKNEWMRVADLPTDRTVMQTGNGELNGYVMTPKGDLLVYDSAKDKWYKETILTPVYNSTNIYQCLLEYEGKLIYAGDGENSAIYSYDFKTKKWELLGLYNFFKIAPYFLPGTIHNERLILGPLLTTGYPNSTNYFLNFNLK